MPKAYYDSYDYPSYWKGRDYEHESEVVAITKLLSLIPNSDTIADIGAGFGRLTPTYIRKANKIFLIEPSKNLLKIAEQNYSKNNKEFKYICATLEELEKHINKETLDVALMVRVMHHLKDPKNSLSTINKTLKKNGYLILEFANKIHGKAVFKSMCSGDFTFPIDITPSDRRCDENKVSKVIPFYNYHPDIIKETLKDEGFKILKTLSVSNVRNNFMKKNVPFNTLLRIEDTLQNLISPTCFGPSIFVLAQKS